MNGFHHRTPGQRPTPCTPDNPAGITQSQREALGWLVTGRSLKEVGVEMGISIKTVEHYVQQLYKRFGLQGYLRCTPGLIMAALHDDYIDYITFLSPLMTMRKAKPPTTLR